MDNIMQLVEIAASGTAALIVFLCLGVYRRYNRRWHAKNDNRGHSALCVVQKACGHVFAGHLHWHFGVYDIWLTFYRARGAFFRDNLYCADFCGYSHGADCPTLYALLLRGFPQFRLRGGHIADALLSLSAPPLLLQRHSGLCRLLRARAQLWRQLLRPQAED